ncbi:Protein MICRORCHIDIA 3 [Arabidopsis thaliana]
MLLTSIGTVCCYVELLISQIQNGATFVKIDKINIVKDNSPALVFQDDGGGMDPDGLRKCMSLGYSSKKSNTTIGQYGNGFKTSTMRLGADDIVFTRSTRGGKSTQSVGLLSYTFLRKTGQDDVVVPMIRYAMQIDIDTSKERPQPIIYGSAEDWAASLEIILKWSPFSTEGELWQQRSVLLTFLFPSSTHQLEDIGTHGTKVIIYNLWLNDEGIYELSFHDDNEDIRLRDESVHDSKRAYASMLYLKRFNNFKIILRGIPVEQFNIADELRLPETIKYNPHTTKEKAPTEIKVGFIKEAPKLAVCGFNVYHKNRLIRPFWKVTMGGERRGSGVVGVLEANFIEPAHDKQDFERSSLFQRLEARLKKIVSNYWNTHCHVFGYCTYGMPADKSKRIAIPDQPPTVNTFNPLPLPSDEISQGGQIIRDQPPTVNTFNPLPLPSDRVSQGGPIIREISLSNATSSRIAAVDTENNLVGKSAHEISEENIQLFMRCEEYVKKETELEQTVSNLAKELEETKSKCARLALLVDAKRREMQQV